MGVFSKNSLQDTNRTITKKPGAGVIAPGFFFALRVVPTTSILALDDSQ